MTKDPVSSALLDAPTNTMNHRCRLYRIGDGITPGSKGHYTEVWDTLEEVYEGDLPSGDPLHEVIHAEWAAARRAMKEYRRAEGIVSVGSWQGRGSI